MKLLSLTIAFSLTAAVQGQWQTGYGKEGFGVGGLASLSIYDEDNMAFRVADIKIDGSRARVSCPKYWSDFSGCMARKCPLYKTNCPALVDRSIHNATAIETRNVTCSEIKGDICSHALEPGCCLGECSDPLLSLTTCMIDYTPVYMMENCTGPMVCMNGTEEVSWYTEPEPEVQEDDDDEHPFIALMENPGQDVGPYSAFTFGSYGVEEMQAECPNEWESWVVCAESDCPDFYDACTGGTTAQENAPAATFDGIFRKRQAVDFVEENPCDDLANDICYLMRGDGCCLQACLAQIQSMASCLHKAKSGVELDTCPTVDCSANPDGLNADGGNPGRPTGSTSSLFATAEMPATESTLSRSTTTGSTTFTSSLFANDKTVWETQEAAPEVVAAEQESVEQATSQLRKKTEDKDVAAELDQADELAAAASGGITKNVFLLVMTIVGAFFM